MSKHSFGRVYFLSKVIQKCFCKSECVLDNRISTWHQTGGCFSLTLNSNACSRSISGQILTSSTAVFLLNDYDTVEVLTGVVSEQKDRPEVFSKVLSNIRPQIQTWKYSYLLRQSTAMHSHRMIVRVGKGFQHSLLER